MATASLLFLVQVLFFLVGLSESSAYEHVGSFLEPPPFMEGEEHVDKKWTCAAQLHSSSNEIFGLYSHLVILVDGLICEEEISLSALDWLGEKSAFSAFHFNFGHCVRSKGAVQASVAIYAMDRNRTLHHFKHSPQLVHRPSSPSSRINSKTDEVPITHEFAASGRIGIMYEGWHAPVAQALVGVEDPLSLDQIIASNGSLTFQDIMNQYNTTAEGIIAYDGFFYHTIPINGTYCIYRKRDNETQGYLPDCANISETTYNQAMMLISAGISFVVADATNSVNPGPMEPPACPGKSCEGDVLQLRPIEVLFEEWYSLRSQGILTPQIAVWQSLNDAYGEVTEWWYMVQRLYLNESYSDLLFRDTYTGKPVFFVPFSSDQGIVSQIEAYNITVVEMWANFNPNQYSQGTWGFMSPCTAGGSSYSTNIAGTVCNQFLTTNSPIGPHGTSLTVGPSYQLMYSSLPFQAASKLGGLTLRSQFVKAFDVTPDYLFIGTFNEAIAQPQNNPYNSIAPQAVSMGMETDPDRANLWVDMLGEISRDVQPTKEYGTFYWDLLQSCLRVYTLSQKLDLGVFDYTLQMFVREQASGGDVVPTLLGEACVTLNTSAMYNNIWSLTAGGGDYIITNSSLEKSMFEAKGYTEICNPTTGPTLFCNAPVSAAWYSKGPFLLFTNDVSTPSEIPRVLLLRCSQNGHYYFALAGTTCEGTPTPMGFLSTRRTGQMPRSLRLCQGAAGYYYHQLDYTCDVPDVELGLLGFVH